MSILLTGGAGFIGSHAAVELLNHGYNIVVVDNLDNSQMEVITRIKELTAKDFPFYKIDLMDSERLDQVFAEHAIEAVMHFAGLKAVGESVEKPLAYYENNITGTLNLCKVMSKYGVKQMVFSSSATVYGTPASLPIDESFPLSATNPYGRTKLMIEEMLADLVVSDASWSIAVLRYFNPVGAHESGRIGESPMGPPNNLMPYITQVAAGKREQLQIFGADYETMDGTGVRDYIHVCDLASGHLKALNYLKNHTGIDSFNLGTGVGYSVLDMIAAFRKVSGIEIPFQISERRPGDVAACYANSQKAQTVLGWRAVKSLEDMCRDSWRWQTENPEGYTERIPNTILNFYVPAEEVLLQDAEISQDFKEAEIG